MQLHHRGVMTFMLGFANDVAPPADHRVEHDQQARYGPEIAVTVEDGDQAQRQRESAVGAEHRPRAQVDKMVIVVAGTAGGHGFYALIRRCCIDTQLTDAALLPRLETSFFSSAGRRSAEHTA